jgi:hypothetical protein
MSIIRSLSTALAASGLPIVIRECFVNLQLKKGSRAPADGHKDARNRLSGI